jgi:hypothetical protein
MFALLAMLAFALLLHKTNGTTFYFDEWDFILRRHRSTVGTFLEPHNEHFSLVPVIVYKLLFATAGLDNYAPYRIVQLVLHVAVAALVFTFVRSRAGDVLALGAGALLLFFGAGFEDVLWPFQMGFLLALACGLGALLLLERESRVGDLGAMLLLGISLASASLGIPFAIGAAAYLAWRPARRRRLWVVAVPVLLYGIWYLDYGHSALKGENVTAAPAYTAEEVAGAVGGVAGLAVEWGRTLAVAAVAALVIHLSRVRQVPRSFAMVLTAAAAFWILTALARAQLSEPTSPRYLYAGGFFVLLIAAEAVRGRQLSRRFLYGIAVLVLLASLSGLHTFERGAGGLRETTRIVRAEITPVEIGGEHMARLFAPAPQKAPQILAGQYLEAVRAIGSSPAYTEAELASLPDEARKHAADGVFVRGYGLRLVPGAPLAAGPAPGVDAGPSMRVVRRGPCVTARPIAPRTSGTVALRLAPGGVSVRAPGAAATLRRFASGYEGAPTLSGAPDRAVLRIPSDRSDRPWHAQFADARSITACGLGGRR